MAATYTCYAFLLRTGAVLTEVDLRGVQPRWAILEAGQLGDSLELPLQSLNARQRAAALEATAPYKYGIALDRDGVIVWSGIITGRLYSSVGGVARLRVPGMLDYWRTRLLTANQKYRDTEQFTIVRNMLTGGPLATVPLLVGAGLSGVERDRTIVASDLAPVADEVLEIADNLDGYELAITSAWAGGTGGRGQRVEHTLNLGHPRLGVDRTDDLLLEHPGNIRSYTWDEDGEKFGTEVWGVSQPDGRPALVTHAATSALTATYGYPAVQRARSWSGISKLATLEKHVDQAAAEMAVYGNLPTVVVADDGDSAVGQWAVGDFVQLRVTDPLRFPRADGASSPGLEIDGMRIQEATLNASAGTIDMTLSYPVAAS